MMPYRASHLERGLDRRRCRRGRRARAFIRSAARTPAADAARRRAPHPRARCRCETLRAAVSGSRCTFERIAASPAGCRDRIPDSRMNLLKVDASELARRDRDERDAAPAGSPAIATTANSPSARFLRDVLSAPIMINNDRILANADRRC